MNIHHLAHTLEKQGYFILDDVYSISEIQQITTHVDQASQNSEGFLKTNDLFAVRQLLKNIPKLKEVLFNTHLISLLSTIYKTKYFLTKAIYFDKPPTSNWFVPYHQDLSISVNQKIDTPNYKNWTYKKGQYGVQPPLKVLENSTAIRIHLDDTTLENGALKVIPTSHSKGIIRTDLKDWDINTEKIGNVKKGGAMLMKPLTLHASNRTTNGKRRRVIHLEFCDQKLESPLEWLEYHSL
ncbi:phytanoyl-CoA dioxygenase [Dokdonia pacifica]|uniref:Phytanoyl-CoA dioxygenase (PhyH) n=1 Tax=Dokdonia pacifica TaxID=1627892 RepID=A0A239CPT5_9FLAO|nr:phytanoyl-CoA dioxygenase family protein [Dokdonia pacifica]GGG39083.1 phytanoyl-CoA dioxygenase [Dokdonia pacifica]SNS22107.1 Phytanoyl-CoA dioxygenase (PhyH) [Dokdonia pacifica]